MDNKNKLISEKVSILLELIKESDMPLADNPLETGTGDEAPVDDSLTAQKEQSDTDSKLIDVIKKLVELTPEDIDAISAEVDNVVASGAENAMEPEMGGEETPDMGGEELPTDDATDLEPEVDPELEDEKEESLMEDTSSAQIGSSAANGLIELVKLLRKVFNGENAEQIKQVLQSMADGAGQAMRNEEEDVIDLGDTLNETKYETNEMIDTHDNLPTDDELEQGAMLAKAHRRYMQGIQDPEAMLDPDDELRESIKALDHAGTKAMMEDMMRNEACRSKMMERFMSEGFMPITEGDDDMIMDTFNAISDDEYTSKEMMESLLEMDDMGEYLKETYMNMFQSASTLGEKPGLGNSGEMYEELMESVRTNAKVDGIDELSICESLYVIREELDSNILKNRISKLLNKSNFTPRHDISFDTLNESTQLATLNLQMIAEGNEEGEGVFSDFMNEEDKNPCWSGYEMVGMKNKDGKEVPNCVPVNESITETTDTERYEDVVFLQGEDAYESMDILNTQGEDAAMDFLKQWHQPGQHMGSNDLGHGTDDTVYEKDGYVLSYNTHLGYIGLEFDTEFTDEEVPEETISEGGYDAISDNEALRAADRAADIVPDAGQAIRGLLVVYGDDLTPMDEFKAVLAQYDLEMEDVMDAEGSEEEKFIDPDEFDMSLDEDESENETISDMDALSLGRKAAEIIPDAKSDIVSLLISYGDDKTPLNRVKEVLAKYDLNYDELMSAEEPESNGHYSMDDLAAQGLLESELKDDIDPVKGDNVDKYNEKNAEDHIEKSLTQIDASQKTEEEKVENLKNQKYEKPEDAVEETDIHRGKSPADVDMDIEDPAYEERTKLEMETGLSRERDEKKMGPIANAGGNSGDPYTVSPKFEQREDTNAGEKEVEKKAARKDHRDNEELYAKEPQPVKVVNENLNEELNKMKSLIDFSFKKNTKPNKMNENQFIMGKVSKKK